MTTTSQIELMKRLTLTPGVSGFEREIGAIMKSEMGKSAQFQKDNMGSITFEFKGKTNKPKIMFIAHMDELGFIVADMLESGFIKFQPIGNWNPNTLLSSPVEVINAKGEKYAGVIGSVPPHFQKEPDAKLDIDNMFMDIGATSKQDLTENFGIQLGDQITPVTNFYYSEKNRRMLSKGLDDRVGIAALVELGKRISAFDHENTIYCVGSVQEELGTRGAEVIANYTDADVCFVLEGAPADDIPGIPFNTQTGVGKGAHVRVFDPTMAAKQELKDFVIDTAKATDIKIQLAVRKSGGTDGREIYAANRGIPSIVLGIPVRYAHSHNCLVSMDDFDELIKLLVNISKKLDAKALENIQQ